MKTVLFIILYLLIGVSLALAPVVINKGIFEYSKFYEYHEKESGFYEHDIGENASSFAIIMFIWPALVLIGLVVKIFCYIGESIMKLHKKNR